MPLTIGQTLQGRYRVVRLLGQGGMGAVYRAWDTRLDVAVAVKEMTPQLDLEAYMLEQLRKQFQREAKVLAKLDHSHLVDVTDFFEQGSNVYLVMKFIEGESLAERIERQGALPEGEMLNWADQLLDALKYCHSQGIIHRDISPQNVIIRPDGQAVLVDFGLVKLWDPRDPRTQTVMRGMGKPEYAPPEQYDAHSGHTDARSDIYGLGATLYHALTGKAPPTATQRIVDPQVLTSVRELKPQISTDFEAAIIRSLELQPSARFDSAAEMARALGSEVQVQPARTKTKMMPRSRLEPTDPQILIDRAKAAVAEGDYDEALTACERALQISPNEREALEVRADIWTRKGDAALKRDDLDAALAAYREAGDDEKIAEVKTLQQQRTIKRMEAQAQIHERAGKWAEAAAVYNRLVSQYPDEESQTKWAKALKRCREEEELAQLFDEGREALEQENWKQAQRAFSELVNRRLNYEKDGLRATQLLDLAAAEKKSPVSFWRRVPLWAWAAGGLIIAALIIAGAMISIQQPYGSLHLVSNRSGKREIYRITRSAEFSQVTHTSSGESWSPVKAPSGSLYFVSDRNGKREIYRLTRDAEVVQVTYTPGNGESWAPAIGPGGTLLFVSNRDGKREVYRLTRDAEIVRVTHTPGSGESWLSIR